MGSYAKRASDPRFFRSLLERDTAVDIQCVGEDDKLCSLVSSSLVLKLACLLVLGSAPTRVNASIAMGMNANGSPESCRRPFHFLARTGSETKSSKKGWVEKVSVRAMWSAPEGYVCTKRSAKEGKKGVESVRCPTSPWHGHWRARSLRPQQGMSKKPLDAGGENSPSMAAIPITHS